MIDSSEGIPPGAGRGEPPRLPPPTGDSSKKLTPLEPGKQHRFFNTRVMFDSKQWRMFNLLLFQQFKAMMSPLWANARKALKRIGKEDPYSSD